MYYIYSKRCQPFSKLNEAEIEWLANEIGDDDKIIVGIVNYNPRKFDSDDNMREDERFEFKFNPLSYWERFCQIDEYLKSNIDDKPALKKVVAITPLPRPSVNIDTAFNYLPDKSDCTFCVSIIHNSEYEERKLYGYKNQKIDKILKIPSHTFSADLRIISPELIFCLIARGKKDWKRFVNEHVAKQLERLQLGARLAGAGLDADTGMERLRRILSRAHDDEKLLLEKLLHSELNDIQSNTSANIVDKKALSDAVKKLFDECFEMWREKIKTLEDVKKLVANTPSAADPLTVQITMAEECVLCLKTIAASEQTKCLDLIFDSMELNKYLTDVKNRIALYKSKVDTVINEYAGRSQKVIKNLDKAKQAVKDTRWDDAI